MNAQESLLKYYELRIQALEQKLDKTELLLDGYIVVNQELNKKLRDDRKS